MLLKWIGGVCIIVSCGSVGFRIAANQRREERSLSALISVLDFMTCELQYRLTPLPDLCRKAAQNTPANLRRLFSLLAQELEDQVCPNVESCMRAALMKCGDLPENTRRALLSLGTTLGKFDLDGQIRGLEAAQQECALMLQHLQRNKDERLRSYQTLGICAGAGLAILFI